MTREEAITYLKVIWNRYKAEYEIERETLDAYHMAIEALSERNIARDIATILENEQDMRAILQNGKLVRCKDCRYWEYVQDDGDCIRHTDDTLGYAIQTNADDFCSMGERREP